MLTAGGAVVGVGSIVRIGHRQRVSKTRTSRPNSELWHRRIVDGGQNTFADVEAFVAEHRGCGKLDGDAGEPGPYGYAVRLAWSCGGRLLRWVTPELAERDLILGDPPTSGNGPP